MCAATFSAVKDMAGELGGVTYEGMPQRKITKRQLLPSWMTWERWEGTCCYPAAGSHEWEGWVHAATLLLAHMSGVA